MKIKELRQRPKIEQDKKLNNLSVQFQKLLNELRNREIPSEIITSINKDVDMINTLPDSGKRLKKQIKNSQTRILKLIEKKLKLVTINYYRTIWLAIGMTVFGVPLGAAFGTALGNMAFLGTGLPLGMVIGMAVGTSMDKKAAANGTQLNLEIKY